MNNPTIVSTRYLSDKSDEVREEAARIHQQIILRLNRVVKCMDRIDDGVKKINLKNPRG